MIFSALWESAKKEELLLIEGGYCRFHIRRDGVLKIYEIISTKKGAGTQLLQLLQEKGRDIEAKCPKEYESNKWYQKKGFQLQKQDDRFNTWVLYSP